MRTEMRATLRTMSKKDRDAILATNAAARSAVAFAGFLPGAPQSQQDTILRGMDKALHGDERQALVEETQRAAQVCKLIETHIDQIAEEAA